MPGFAYIDASAITKLIIPEQERSALQAAILEKDGVFSSRLALTECRRASMRYGQEPLSAAVDDVFETLLLLDVTPEILSGAGALQPASLRSLDAIHVSSALSLGDPSIEFITYDRRMADAARANGLTVVQPGL